MTDTKSRVVLIPCDSYDSEKVYESLKKGIELVGGLEAFAKKDDRILMKPNLLKKASVDKAVITHPSVAAAFGRLLKEAGYDNIFLADSAGFGSTTNILKGTGMDTAMKDLGIDVIDYSEGVETAYPEGHLAKSFILPKELLEADCIFSLCKMKTHALERITGAVKNSYGFIYGTNKALGHTKYPSADSFARMLVDLNQCVGPKLFIMDGIVAMEGNGPGSGDPVPMNVLLLSTDPVALDTVFSHLIYLNPNIVPTNYHGNMLGLGTSDPEKIEIVMPEGPVSLENVVERFGNPDFNVVRGSENKNFLDRLTAPFRAFKKKPVIIEKNCIKCGICVESCPVDGKAVDFKNGRDNPPVYNYKKCIRCFCCQEMCPQKAISVK